mmetsp:Transcript_38463/g.68840  ORF Transcript_38463/g.68840 Transcript_38463/m.68840 type:complete len:227 (-) Transcript_38463:3794-4474(-)
MGQTWSPFRSQASRGLRAVHLRTCSASALYSASATSAVPAAATLPCTRTSSSRTGTNGQPQFKLRARSRRSPPPLLCCSCKRCRLFCRSWPPATQLGIRRSGVRAGTRQQMMPQPPTGQKGASKPHRPRGSPSPSLCRTAVPPCCSTSSGTQLRSALSPSLSTPRPCRPLSHTIRALFPPRCKSRDLWARTSPWGRQPPTAPHRPSWTRWGTPWPPRTGTPSLGPR